MKQLMMAAFCCMMTFVVKAQVDTVKADNLVMKKDSSRHKQQTKLYIRLGSDGNTFKIKHDTVPDKPHIGVRFNSDSKRKLRNISTNWWVFDLGFANVVDNTNYTTAQTQGYLNPVNGAITQNAMDLRAWKTSNVNLWFFMQKLNVSHHVFNLKYGFGLEMYNFRYEHNISYRSNPYPNIFMDTISFSKNKLYAGYLTVPFMLNFNFTPSKKNGLSISAGVSAGYLVGSHQKQISGERGKQKFRDDFDLNPWRFAAIGDIGLGRIIRLYGSYSFNNLYKKSTGLDQTPYAVGIRFSKW